MTSSERAMKCLGYFLNGEQGAATQAEVLGFVEGQIDAAVAEKLEESLSVVLRYLRGRQASCEPREQWAGDDGMEGEYAEREHLIEWVESLLEGDYEHAACAVGLIPKRPA
jgi:hypothetical protein